MTDPLARRAFSTLVAAACVDGDLADPEREVLHRKATEYDIPVAVMRELIDQGVRGKLPVSVPPGRAAKEELLDDLIDVACADGRIEGPEHHLLAKFASHLGIALPELRARVRKRLERKSKPSDPPAPRPAAPEPPPKPIAPPTPPVAEAPAFARGPVTLAPPTLIERGVEDIPPVTLHLLKQAIVFETEPDALRYIERTMNISKAEARELMTRILAAVPDLKAGSQQLRGASPRK